MSNRYKNDTFQQLAGECLFELEKYKLKTNLLGCNLRKEDFDKYYSFYSEKPKTRLSYVKSRVAELVRCFEKNQVYMMGLQLKSLNNMMRNFRKRMDLLMNEPTDFNYAKFQKEEGELLEAIVLNDVSKANKIENIYDKIKFKDSEAMKTLQEKLKELDEPANFQKCVHSISKAEIRYCRFFDTFERSVANMINQMNAYIDKLCQFYTMWENLGSSIIYELPSQRQDKIDRGGIERPKELKEQTEEEVKKKLDSLPLNSNMRDHYEKKLQLIQEKEDEKRRKLETGGNLFFKKKSNKGIIKNRNFTLQKTPWYQTPTGQRIPFNLDAQMLLSDKNQKSYFRYTYEELHRQTRDLRRQVQEYYSQKIDTVQDIEIGLRDFHQNYFDRRKKNSKPHQWFYATPQMRFNCWYDRSAVGHACILDFPMNIVQKKLQFQIDRQSEMDLKDDKRKKDYNLKQTRINRIDERRNFLQIGYRFLDEGRELQYLKTDLCKKYNPSFLPQPLKQVPVDEFSNSDEEMDENCHLLAKIQREKSKEFEKTGKGFGNREEVTDKFHWFQAKERQEEKESIFTNPELDVFKKFVKFYLPQLQIQQMKKNIEWETSKSQFFYQSDLGYGELKIRIQQNFSAKVFVVDHNYFLKIQPLFFQAEERKLKINIFVIVGEPYKIKNQVQEMLSSLGELIFYVKKVSKSAYRKEKEETILGGVMMFQKEEKYEGMAKTKVNFEDESFEEEAKKTGLAALSQFKKYLERIKSLD